MNDTLQYRLMLYTLILIAGIILAAVAYGLYVTCERAGSLVPLYKFGAGVVVVGCFCGFSWWLSGVLSHHWEDD